MKLSSANCGAHIDAAHRCGRMAGHDGLCKPANPTADGEGHVLTINTDGSGSGTLVFLDGVAVEDVRFVGIKVVHGLGGVQRAIQCDLRVPPRKDAAPEGGRAALLTEPDPEAAS